MRRRGRVRSIAIIVMLVVAAACSSKSGDDTAVEAGKRAGTLRKAGASTTTTAPGGTTTTVAPGGPGAKPGGQSAGQDPNVAAPDPGNGGGGDPSDPGPGPGPGPNTPSAPPGPGVTDSTITIGFVAGDEQSQNAAYDAVGAKGLDAGPQHGAAKAMIEYINKNGGIAGRQVKPVFYMLNFNTANASTQQEMCARFTEENKTFAVITNLVAETLLPCLAKRQTVLLQEDTAVGDAADFAQYAPYYYAPAWFNQTVNAKVYVDALVQQGFFGSGSKVGLIRWKNPSFDRAAKEVRNQLATHNIKISEEAAWQGLAEPAAASSAVLRFKTAGINRVLVLDYHANIMFTFGPQADSQGFKPKYGLNSFSLWDFLVKNVPASQLEGAVGVGHRPLDDVNSRDHNATVQRCLKIYRDAGLTIRSSAGARYTLAYCDLLLFLKQNLDGAPGVNADVLRSRVAALAASYESPLTFGTRFSPQALGGASAYRMAAYSGSCQCFQYTGGPVTHNHG